jgi:flagellar basal-body rod protein FlgC
MDIFRTLNISASGMTAQRVRMDVISENLANVDASVTANGVPYRRKVVRLQSDNGPGFPSFLQLANHGGPSGANGQVRVAEVLEVGDPPRRLYQPGHPQADGDGYVTMPNLNPLVEMLDMLTASRAYEANATAFQASKAMGTKLLELLR